MRSPINLFILEKKAPPRAQGAPALGWRVREAGLGAKGGGLAAKGGGRPLERGARTASCGGAPGENRGRQACLWRAPARMGRIRWGAYLKGGARNAVAIMD